MADQQGDPDDRSPEDEFREMLRELLSGAGGIDPSKLAGVISSILCGGIGFIS